MKHTPLLSTILSLFVGITLLAQNQTDFTNKEWTLIHQEQGINFYQKFSNCDLPSEGLYANYILIKVENTLNEPTKVQWQNLIHYNNKCTNCSENYTPPAKTINAGESLIGQCSYYSDNMLRIFHSWNNKTNKHKLTKIAIANVKTQAISHE